MGTRLVHIVVDANDPGRLARFWAAALGWEVADETPDEVDVWPADFSYPDPVALPLVFVPVPEPKITQNRVHLDLATRSREDQLTTVRRLLTLGATRIDIGQGDVPWTVLADPEGNEFCVLEPRPVYAETGPVAAVVSGCADPAVLTGFWELAAGFARVQSEDGFESLRSRAGTGPFLELLRVPGAKTVKNRVHLDVRSHFGEDQAEAVAALRAAGAMSADVGQGDVGWTVLADPEGSEFCVLTSR
jgi:hypothetical protein